MNAILNSDMEEIIKDPIVKEFCGGTVLVTGAGGMIGSYLVHFFIYLSEKLGKNVRVLALVRNRRKAEEIFAEYLGKESFCLIVHDVSEPFEIEEKVDYIIHAASQASPKYYNVDPVGTLKANTFGTYRMLELARIHEVKGMLFVSSGEVYGQTDHIPTKETDYGYIDIEDVRNCYSESKRIGEVMCRAYQQQYEIPVKSVRLFHTYGPGITFDDGRIFGDIVKGIVKERKLILRSDGSAIRTFCYVADAILGMLYVMLRGRDGESYNLSNENGKISILNLMEMMSKEYGIPLLRDLPIKGYMPSTISITCPDIEKIKALGFNPCYSLKKGFNNTIKWAESSTKKQ